VVLVPGLGDEVQALKAGIMEIADIFVVNKADREGVDRVVAEIQSMLGMGHGEHVPEIVTTVASANQGTEEVVRAIDAYSTQAATSGLLDRKRRAHLKLQFEEAVRARVMSHVWSKVVPASALDVALDRLARREIDPFTAAEAVLEGTGL
jgi:LAO/AO transport system kinase